MTRILLSDLVTEMRNGTTATQNDEGRGLPVTRIETISDGSIDLNRVRHLDGDSAALQRWRLKPGDILLSHINSVEHIGKSALYSGHPETLIHGMNLLLLRPDGSKVLPEFLQYGLRSAGVRSHIRTRCKRAINQASINQKELGSIELEVPSLAEQRRVVDLLSRAENIVRMRREAEVKAKEIIPALFEDMFGDPGRNAKGWTVSPLRELVDESRPITYGILKPGPDLVDGVPYVRVVDIRGGQILTDQLRRTSEGIEAAYRRSRLRGGDLLMSIRGHVGRMAVVPDTIAGANITQDSARIAPRRGVEVAFLCGYLESHATQQEMKRLTKGVAVRGINLGDLKALQVPVPPLEKQQEFAARFHDVRSLVTMQAESIALSKATFQSLLAGVFGEGLQNA